ncbi:sugar ABC transporter ATP-binding protein [Candidatus Puniceispirillum marinum]|uniref:ABC transporter related protein n=1 Tax=Puniceispirillum marinum (strain IMCC1322) TaxID=488538 RepID=D5BMH0_PUNMI|nr:sugar ABC transporter ATP-binding protein [Candidatus Puniceispirillum marinum]ADE40013.1 ABC transporter related protein [Candidatus Puniceispirillum marinum IMCC1322]
MSVDQHDDQKQPLDGDSGHPHHLISTTGLSKDYQGIRALDRVDFNLQAGEVHVLFGENGAGKSTMISMLAGAIKPTAGTILFKGQQVSLTNVHHAHALGIRTVFQEFSLVPQMSVAENIFLGSAPSSRGFLQRRTLKKKAQEVLDGLNFTLDPDMLVDGLTRAEQQMVEIAKAFRSDLSVLILDEPTASLTDIETKQLFKLIAHLKSQNVGIIYITHRLAEIQQIGDRITVLRDGKSIKTIAAKDATEDLLIGLMSGRKAGSVFPKIKSKPGETVLQVKNLITVGGQVNNVSLHVRRGEIIGLAGLVGSGKSKFGQACFGALRISSGEITLKGEIIQQPKIGNMLARGFLYVPSDRRQDGLFMMRPARENISIPSLERAPFSKLKGYFLNHKGESDEVSELIKRLTVSPPEPERLAAYFSGGNQQKLMLIRSLTRQFDLIIFDEPTVGVDVSTRAIIYEFIAELCANGVAIVLISSDLPEILNLSSRVYVFSKGQVRAELRGSTINETNVLSHFFDREVA